MQIDNHQPHKQQDGQPWYKEFWGWFVFMPLFIVIIACSVTVTIAFKGKDDVVVDDYYKIGKMINQSFVPEENARTLNVRSVLQFDDVSGELWVQLHSDELLSDDAKVMLEMSHPILSKRDRIIQLSPVSTSNWRADIDFALDGRWYLRLSAYDAEMETEMWRVRGEMDFSVNATTALPYSLEQP